MANTCLWEWTEYGWECIEECEAGYECSPPSSDGSYIGETVETLGEPIGSA